MGSSRPTDEMIAEYVAMWSLASVREGSERVLALLELQDQLIRRLMEERAGRPAAQPPTPGPLKAPRRQIGVCLSHALVHHANAAPYSAKLETALLAAAAQQRIALTFGVNTPAVRVFVVYHIDTDRNLDMLAIANQIVASRTSGERLVVVMRTFVGRVEPVVLVDQFQAHDIDVVLDEVPHHADEGERVTPSSATVAGVVTQLQK